MVSVLEMKDLKLREVKWFEHGQDLNPGLPKACCCQYFRGGGGRRRLGKKY